ncbi:MAG TPA: energy transducer TonB [Steroidobacteraceae bacterium]|nr:energy transducer TonB [Steroidobacteraceae bacterium]
MTGPAASAASDPLLAPLRLRRRRTDEGEGRATRDRLYAMLVLAALLHGLVLLGVTFTAPGSRSDIPRGLEVLLVSEELPEASDNDDAAYIAQRSQEGSGNTRDRLTAELPGTTPQTATEASQQQRLDRLEEQLLTTAVPSLSTIQIEAVPEPELLLSQQELEQLLAGEDALRLRGENREQLYISPDTRASRLAPYLDGWRRRVEQVGTLNFPASARLRGESGSLVLEVAIHNDGRLRSATIQRSSGHPALDEAARDILQLASPFDPFPPELARDYRSLRFAYEWRFEGGQPAGTAVTLP